MEQGRTSCARSNDGDGCHTNRTAPTTVHSHTPRGSITTNSPQNGISRNGTRQLHRKREMSRPCSTLRFGAHAPCAEALWKTRRRVFVPIPFRRHVTPIHNKNITQSPSVTSPPQQQRGMTRPCLLPFVQANGWTRPTTRN